MLSRRMVLIITAVAETLTGLAFLLAPNATSGLLFGAHPDHVGLMIGRLAGVALVAIGISCWGAGRDPGGTAQAATFRGATLYNAGAGVLLLLFAVTGQASGFVIWVAGVFHLIMAGFAAARRGAGARHPAAAGGKPSSS